MRVDLLLKALCLVKTRSQGKKGCEAGAVKINGKAVKPGREVKAGDILEIKYPKRVVVAEIVDVPRGQVARKDRDDYVRILRERKTEAEIW